MSSASSVSTVYSLDFSAIQAELQKQKLDGWLFYYFHENDPLALRILKLEGDHFFSRRWFYFIPAVGQPQKLVHRIEDTALDSLPGQTSIYLGWRQLELKLKELLGDSVKVAMQYSPRNAVPYVSKVDGGILDLLKEFGMQVVSSGDLVQQFESIWSESQLQSHIEAATILRQTVFAAFQEIKRRISEGDSVNEYEIQQFILSEFERHQMTTNSPPIVAVNEHSGSPHYQPNVDKHWPIKKNDFVLLDIWAKKKEPADAVYADITWTGYVGDTVPARHQEIFAVVAGGRDAALNFVRAAVAQGRKIHGWEVDDAARNYITAKGYGDYFVHRTGHSIGIEVHGNGCNIDNLETKDERTILPNTAFSIEPGVYLKDFGVRSEIDVFVSKTEVIVAGGDIQTEVVAINSL
jgi:Xaa-Pro aminopeptidase